MTDRLDRALFVGGPVALCVIAFYATARAGVDGTLADSLNAGCAFLIPAVWGALGHALYSGASRRLEDANDFMLLIVPAGIAVAVYFALFSGEKTPIGGMFAIGTIFGLFVFLQTPDRESSDIQQEILDWLSPGLLVAYASILSGVGLGILLL